MVITTMRLGRFDIVLEKRPHDPRTYSPSWSGYAVVPI